MTISFGYTLSSEENTPQALVGLARRAEDMGFEFVSISDHFHPWVEAQGHSPFVWSVLGGIATTTSDIRVGVGVTCPIMRIHPAIIAHAAATTSLLFEGRFFLGLGTGEALNEHVLGHRWPRPEVRLAMLEEAVEVMRHLWSGETIDHRGTFYEVENARLFDPPTDKVPLVISAFGPKAIDLAARIGDGYWGTAPDKELVDRYANAGGHGPRYAQIGLCWSHDAAEARATVHRVWPIGGLKGQLLQDLPTWSHFEAAAEPLSEAHTTDSVPCGPDVEAVIDSVRAYVDAGYDHLYFHQIGPDQEGFFTFWQRELQPALRDFAAAA